MIKKNIHQVFNHNRWFDCWGTSLDCTACPTEGVCRIKQEYQKILNWPISNYGYKYMALSIYMWYINIWYLQMKMNARGTLAWMEPLVTILWDHSLASVLMDSWAICVIMVKFTEILIRFIIENNCKVNYCFSLISKEIF